MSHTCHALGCERVVPPKMFMCRRHWWMLDPNTRGLVWLHYRPGQEVDKNPSDAYLAVALDAITEIADREGKNAHS